MKTAIIAGLLLLSASVGGYAEEPSRFHVSGAAGPALWAGPDTPSYPAAIHLGAGLAYSVKPYLTVGADLSYSYPRATYYGTGRLAAPIARAQNPKADWGLVTLTAAARPSARVSPYLVLGFGLGRYVDSSKQADFGKAAALGAGLNVSLSSRATLFVEGRLALGVFDSVNDGLHGELHVRIGVRFGL